MYYRVRHEQSPARFGFILSRRVAGSVDRNLIRRRFRAVARELIDGGFTDNDVVVRVKPGLVVPSWSRIRADLRVAVGAET